ncbi:hypothetical protein AMATHDRAFT_138507 [Amanita thiersii Skay4041]|uniref:MARVEL domain-containing protein n=1 Tax=Amanita thiersii Skay4041 TaxID=703135 RepID=A0A2A9NXM5_9AGAR|nr:hypothetical protein AMATHDRAFT_138507 [Amanita thiersii Skay4041]
MPLLDHITDAFSKFAPSKSSKSSTSISGVLGNGHGIIPFDDNMIVSKPTVVFHVSQIFFNFLAMACFASVASFQAKWDVGPSGLTGFAIFVSVSGMFLSAFMLLVPVIYEKYDKMVRVARALKEVRVAFILTGTGVTFSLLIAFITTISAWTQAGCKNPDNDPHSKEKGDDFKNGLSGWCNTKKAGAIFFWLAFVFWAASLGLLVYYWRSGKLAAPRDPPFIPPHHNHDDEEVGDEESMHTSIPPAGVTPVSPILSNRYDNSNAINSPFADSNRQVPATTYNGYSNAVSSSPPVRASLDVYGAFSDPAPTGFNNMTGLNNTYDTTGARQSHQSASPVRSNIDASLPTADYAPRVSRTMQYADPYAVVRASLTSQGSPPSYESYQTYR